MSETNTFETKWNAIYSQKTSLPVASKVLRDHQHLLPQQGVALDLACGQGGNALLLAQLGLEVHAWDASSVAIEQVKERAVEGKLLVKAERRDVTQSPPEPNSLDVLVVSFFLDRALCPVLYDALRPKGLIFYQTYCQDKVSEQGPRSSDFLLADNELLDLFSGMKVRVYHEESLLGRHDKGWRNQALLVAEK